MGFTTYEGTAGVPEKENASRYIEETQQHSEFTWLALFQ